MALSSRDRGRSWRIGRDAETGSILFRDPELVPPDPSRGSLNVVTQITELEGAGPGESLRA